MKEISQEAYEDAKKNWHRILRMIDITVRDIDNRLSKLFFIVIAVDLLQFICLAIAIR